MTTIFNRISLRSIRRRILALILLICLFTASAGGTGVNAASLPALDAQMTTGNIMSILNTYDSDGAYLANYALNKDGFNYFLQGFVEPGTSAVDSLDTVVHESFHEYAIPNSTSGAGPVTDGEENIYIGHGKSVNVKYTDVFRSKEMAKSVPAKCRTSHYGYKQGDRFATYIKDVSNTMAADWEGAYGLLNEFTGYCWGMNTNIKTYSYRDKFADDTETWSSFITEGESDRLAYIEFKYYILHYLYYAKQHHPDVYSGIINNKNFRRAYRLTESRFSKNIDKYDSLLEDIADKLSDNGYTLSIDKLSLRRQYNAMSKELSKSQYKAIQKEVTRK